MSLRVSRTPDPIISQVEPGLDRKVKLYAGRRNTEPSFGSHTWTFDSTGTTTPSSVKERTSPVSSPDAGAPRLCVPSRHTSNSRGISIAPRIPGGFRNAIKLWRWDARPLRGVTAIALLTFCRSRLLCSKAISFITGDGKKLKTIACHGVAGKL